MSKIIFCNSNQKTVNIYKQVFLNFPKDKMYLVLFEQTRFENIKENIDCLVNAGNSYGIMTGGLDGAIGRYFSNTYKFTKLMQKYLMEKTMGQQMPGTCYILDTRDIRIPYLAHVTTMMYPEIIDKNDLVYWCIWNLLIKIYKHNKTNTNTINNICICGLGNGVGGISDKIFAEQSKLAILHFIESYEKNDYITWSFAGKRYYELQSLIKRQEKINTKKVERFDRINKIKKETIIQNTDISFI